MLELSLPAIDIVLFLSCPHYTRFDRSPLEKITSELLQAENGAFPGGLTANEAAGAVYFRTLGTSGRVAVERIQSVIKESLRLGE